MVLSLRLSVGGIPSLGSLDSMRGVAASVLEAQVVDVEGRPKRRGRFAGSKATLQFRGIKFQIHPFSPNLPFPWPPPILSGILCRITTNAPSPPLSPLWNTRSRSWVPRAKQPQVLHYRCPLRLCPSGLAAHPGGATAVSLSTATLLDAPARAIVGDLLGVLAATSRSAAD
jgi:hypothetical protein